MVPDERLSVRKVKNYWDKRGWKLPGVDFVQLSQGPQEVNAIRSGQIDTFAVADQGTADAVKTGSGLGVLTQASDSAMFFFDMCRDQPPFDKLKVRQAAAYTIDRNALNQAANSGDGIVTDELWPKGSQFYFPEFADKYPHNPKKARRLLQQAGAAGATFDLMTYPAPAFQQVVPAVQEQLKKVGLNARIVQTTNIAQDLYIAKKAPSNILSTINPGVAKLNNLTPKFLTNYCGYDRPDVTAAIETLKSSPDPAKQKDAWRTAQKAMVDDVPFLVLYFGPVRQAYVAKKVGGVTQMLEQGQGPSFRQMYLKK
ncbi:MAG: hypothetical protein E6G60_11675 [Actinobacteria bacterium]|nr:MAG: hypothetical protein E6G60_11675 [Actinomycetota bacterium]